MMRNWLKYALIIIAGLILLIIVVPLIINWFILKERQFEIVGGVIDWLQFWPVYLSAIGTIAMSIATFYVLKANRKQMESMTVSEGAQLVFSLSRDYEYVLLKITNVGRSVAKNIQLRIPNRFEIIERNAAIPFGEGLIKHFNNLNTIPLLLPNQSEYIPLYMYRALSESIKDQNGVKTVEVFGDKYSPENIAEIGEYLKNETFTVTGFFVNYLNQQISVNQKVDNTYNVSLADENKIFESAFRELNRNILGIKTELFSMDNTLKKIERKIKN